MEFHKYEGAGNDFILIDARNELPFSLGNQQLINWLCDRHFGIGADGLMLLRSHDDYDFEMVYYNADGGPSSMCGNGGRCIVAFARQLGIIDEQCSFLAVDGPHTASILPSGEVSLAMSDVQAVESLEKDFILDTGSPHYIRFASGIQEMDLIELAHGIRYNERFATEGINVNLLEPLANGQTAIRTYERGVEDETLACGTGVTAAAISLAMRAGSEAFPQHFRYELVTKGGVLTVSGARNAGGFNSLFLTGPATFVFEGKIALPNR